MTDSPTPADLSQPFGSYHAMLARWAEVQPDKVALRDEAGELTWSDFHDRIERIAARLVEDGLERGQSVAILGTSTIPYALVFLGTVRAGGVAAPLTTSASPDQLAGMAKDSGARHIFIDRAKVAELGKDAFSGMTRIVLDEDLDGWMAPEGTRAPPFDPDPADPFNIIYSSGTTGIPKGIVHSHQMRWRQFAYTAASWLERSGATSEPIVSLASTPLYSNTTMIAFLPPLLAGGTVRIMGKFDTLRWLSHAERDRTTITMLVPVQYQRLMDEPRLDAIDLSALVVKYCTSAPFSADLKREVLQRMPGALIEIYSMTEGGVVCLLAAHEFPDKLHTVGRPAPGSELKVLDDEDREVPPGHTGQPRRPEPDDDGGLQEPARQDARRLLDRPRHRPRLAADGRYREGGCGRLRRVGRPRQGHDHLRRVQHLPGRPGNGVAEGNGRRRSRGDRHAEPQVGRNPGRFHGDER